MPRALDLARFREQRWSQLMRLEQILEETDGDGDVWTEALIQHALKAMALDLLDVDRDHEDSPRRP